MIGQKEHTAELDAFFVSKYKKDKRQDRLKRNKKPYHTLRFLSKVGEYSLVDKNNVSISKVVRVPKKHLDSSLEEEINNIDQNKKRLLDIKYNILFELGDEKQYETILNKIDPLEIEIKKNKSEIDKFTKIRKELMTKVNNQTESFSMEKQLIVEQLQEENDMDSLEQYIKVTKELFDTNQIKRDIESSIIEIDV